MAIIADAGRKVFMILDTLGVHHCKPVKQWLAEHSEQMEVFYLPSYSLELNPEERLNADLKQVVGRKAPCAPKENYAPLPNSTWKSSAANRSESKPTSAIRASSMPLETI